MSDSGSDECGGEKVVRVKVVVEERERQRERDR